MQIILSLFEGKGLRVAADHRSNSLIVLGSSDDITQVEAILMQLDGMATRPAKRRAAEDAAAPVERRRDGTEIKGDSALGPVQIQKLKAPDDILVVRGAEQDVKRITKALEVVRGAEAHLPLDSDVRRAYADAVKLLASAMIKEMPNPPSPTSATREAAETIRNQQQEIRELRAQIEKRRDESSATRLVAGKTVEGRPRQESSRRLWGQIIVLRDGLPWRPPQLPAAEQVKMDVVDRLAAVRAAIDDHAVAVLQAAAVSPGCESPAKGGRASAASPSVSASSERISFFGITSTCVGAFGEMS